MEGRLTFLGTGTSTGVPEIGCLCPTCQSTDPRDHRYRTSALVEIAGKTILFDCTPDFRSQMLAISANRLDAIFLTHEHYDHVGGLDDTRPLFRNNIPCPIYAEENVIDALRNRMPYAFSENRYPGVPNLDLIPIRPYQPISITNEVSLTPLRVMHGKLPIIGFKIGGLSYITDCKVVPKETLESLKGTDTLILNALRHYPHPSHIAYEEALDIVKEIAPRRAYFIHFAHNFGKHQELEELFPKEVYPAYDFLRITFPYPTPKKQ